MPESPSIRLSARQRECLELVGRGQSNKDIAAALNIAPGTVASYIAEAKALLGARSRGEAARILAEADAAAPRTSPGHETGVAPSPIARSAGSPSGPVAWRDWLPLRKRGAAHNDLSVLVRLAWIPAIAVGLAIGFGMLAVAFDTVSRLTSHLGQ